MVHGEIIYGKHAFAFACFLTLLVGQLTLLNLDVVFLCKVFQSLIVGHLLQFHDEIDRTASLSAAEAFAYPLGLAHRETWGALIVKGAQTYVAGASALEMHKVAHHLHNVGGVKDALYGARVNFLISSQK